MEHIRGDTFDFSGPVTLTIEGEAVTDFSSWTAASQIRTKDSKLIADLTTEWLDTDEGLLRVYFDGSTADWPVGNAEMDVQFTHSGGDIISTQVAAITIVRDVTRGQS